MEILSKLLGGPARVKILRMFVFNPDEVFDAKDLNARTKVTPPNVRRELNMLKAIKLVRPKVELRTVGKNKKKINGWQLNPNFSLTEPLRELLAAEMFPDYQLIAKRFAGMGKIQGLAIAGVFLRDERGYVDLVVIGENLNRGSIEQTIRSMEAEIGKELTYAILTTDDFLYRLHSSDKFTRDLFDHPHKFLVDKINIK
ncbi:MAG TPA: hypothetical protein VEB60_02580 [Candidatus Paceibacterota bacterium]|nr:hypothetical protein [Candidatus Paceibacterota bacterium]